MTITVTYKLYEVGVLPTHGQLNNVVARVSWGVEYEQEGLCTHHSEVALLQLDDLSSFVPIEQLTKDQIIAWCIQSKGGEEYMQGLLGAHQHLLQEKIAQKNIVPYSSFPVDEPPYPATPPVTIPTEVL